MNYKKLIYILLGRVRNLEIINEELSGITLYQKTVDGKVITTTGINTYINNKMDPTLTIDKEVGGLELDEITGRIVNNSGKSKRFLFDAVATVANPSAPNMKVYFTLYKNGTENQEQTTSYTKLESTTGAATLNAATEIVLDNSEYVEVFCMTDKTDGSFTLEHMQLRLIETHCLCE